MAGCLPNNLIGCASTYRGDCIGSKRAYGYKPLYGDLQIFLDALLLGDVQAIL